MHDVCLRDCVFEGRPQFEARSECVRPMLFEHVALNAVGGLHADGSTLGVRHFAVGRVDRHRMAACGNCGGHIDHGLGRPPGALGDRRDDMQDANGLGSGRRQGCADKTGRKLANSGALGNVACGAPGGGAKICG